MAYPLYTLRNKKQITHTHSEKKKNERLQKFETQQKSTELNQTLREELRIHTHKTLTQTETANKIHGVSNIKD